MNSCFKKWMIAIALTPLTAMQAFATQADSNSNCEIYLLVDDTRLATVDEENGIRLESNQRRIGIIENDHFYRWPRFSGDIFAAYRHSTGMIIDFQQRYLGYVDEEGKVFTRNQEAVAQVTNCDLTDNKYRTQANALAYFAVLLPVSYYE